MCDFSDVYTKITIIEFKEKTSIILKKKNYSKKREKNVILFSSFKDKKVIIKKVKCPFSKCASIYLQ